MQSFENNENYMKLTSLKYDRYHEIIQTRITYVWKLITLRGVFEGATLKCDRYHGYLSSSPDAPLACESPPQRNAIVRKTRLRSAILLHTTLITHALYEVFLKVGSPKCDTVARDSEKLQLYEVFLKVESPKCDTVARDSENL